MLLHRSEKTSYVNVCYCHLSPLDRHWNKDSDVIFGAKFKCAVLLNLLLAAVLQQQSSQS